MNDTEVRLAALELQNKELREAFDLLMRNTKSSGWRKVGDDNQHAFPFYTALLTENNLARIQETLAKPAPEPSAIMVVVEAAITWSKGFKEQSPGAWRRDPKLAYRLNKAVKALKGPQ